MIDESYRAAPFVPTSPEELAATYAAIQQEAATRAAVPVVRDDLHDVILNRLQGEQPDGSFIMHWELAGDIAKDIRCRYQLTPKALDGSD